MSKFLISFLIVFSFSLSVFAQKNVPLPFDDSNVAVIKITIDPNYLNWIYDPAHAQSDSLFPCSVFFKNAQIDTVVHDVGFRLRGNTSRKAAKKSFKLSFNAFEPGRKFYGVEKLNLNGEHNDPSIVRSKLCWNFFAKIGLKASHAAHAAVYINGAYYGLYILVEHIDENFLRQYFAHPFGNLWKCLWPADLNYRGNEAQNYFPFYGHNRPYELKTNKTQYDFEPLAHLVRILNKTDDGVFIDSLISIFDVQDLFKYFATNLLVGSWDDYWSLMNNYYLYYDYLSGKFHLIPYDYDNTFGVDFFGIDWANADIYDFPKVQKGYRPLAERLMKTPSLRNVYSHFLKFYRDSVFALQLWSNEISHYEQMIAPFVRADTFRSKDYGFTMDDFYHSYDLTHYENQHVKYGLKEFITRRYYTAGTQIKFADAAPLIYSVHWFPFAPRPNDSIRFEVLAFGFPDVVKAEVWLQPGNLTQINKFPLHFSPDYSTHRAEDRDRWCAVLPPLGTQSFAHFQVMAQNSKGQTRFYPARGGIKISTAQTLTFDLVINEFLAKNDHTNADPAGDYDDWVELFNRGITPVALAGKFLTDNPAFPNKWVFPDTTSPLSAGAFRLVWCDKDEEQAGLHASFKLSAGGEFIGLVDDNGQTFLDSLHFGPQSADISYGRYPDGASTWRFLSPTPDYSNSATPIIETQFHQPQTFRLLLFPNPFNPTVSIRLTLNLASPVQISIYDIQGKRVWYKSWTRLAAGIHVLHWQASSVLASGMYFVVLQTSSLKRTKKILLLR